jgi:predicted ArsR family transcriptional regulator
MDLERQVAGIGALADATRRNLYEYVIAQREPVGREQAAKALDLALHTASFHLDKLVAEGLLEVEYRRLSGRTGPGAGRPSKLYKRAQEEFAISLPPRHYDLVGDILASAVVRVDEGEDLTQALHDSAHEEGLAASSVVAPGGEPDSQNSVADAIKVLRAQGFEPQIEDELLVLHNCPFDSLAQKHTDLVCGLNVDFVQGVLDGTGCSGLKACLDPGPGRCCVTLGLT